MIAPAVPINEKSRLEALYSYNILDSLPEEEYDSITKLASTICGAPISIITIIDKDRQWFKSNTGLAASSAPRELGFCSHTILQPEKPLVVNNTLIDERFKDNPFAIGEAKLEFYAGIALVTDDGHALGTLCVLDHCPREITESQLDALQILTKQIIKLLELRKSVEELSKTKIRLQQSLDNLDDFANIVAHDIQAPVRNMGLFADIIAEDYEHLLDDEGKKMLKLMSENAVNAREYVSGVLKYSRASHISQLEQSNINLNLFFQRLLQLTDIPNHLKIEIDEGLPQVFASEIALQQIFNNLISNAIKYNDKEEGSIKISGSQDDSYYHISIIDNGRGIPSHMLERIFNIFVMVDKKDVTEKNSSGIGLSIVKKIVAKMDGLVKLQSKEGVGSTFTISLPRH